MSLLALLQAGWSAYSFTATLAGTVGIGLVLLALLATAWLPAFVRHCLVVSGLIILACAGALQLGQYRGAHQALLLQAKLAQKAEAIRADLAEKTVAADAAQAAKDRADLAAQNDALKELLDVQSKSKDRAAECVGRDVARRLRDL
jgi:hypothetical protein